MSDSSSPESDHRVIAFRRHPGNNPAGRQRREETAPVGDLQKFQQTDEIDDYRHRMTINVAAAAFTLMLIFAGLWLADTLTTMRKNQDCVLTGRRGCTPVDAPVQPRGEANSLQQH